MAGKKTKTKSIEETLWEAANKLEAKPTVSLFGNL